MPITPGVYQRLGIRAYWMIFFRKSQYIFGPVLLAVLILVGSNYVPISAAMVAPLNQLLVLLILISGATFVGSFLVSAFQYMAFSFMLDEHALKIRTGILNIQNAAIPYRQMQNVDIERGILYRLLGVSKIVILTAGTEDVDTHVESEGLIPVLDKDLAAQVQEELLHRSDVEKTVVVPDTEQHAEPPEV